MNNLLVVDNPAQWQVPLANARVVTSQDYLTDATLGDERGCTVFNLCRSYRYQSQGYYVSLLAQARGHRVLPDIATIQGMRSADIVRAAAGDLSEIIEHSLRGIKGDRFELSIYFGRNLAKAHTRLARELFDLFPAPLLRATFHRRDQQWVLHRLRLIPASEVPSTHRDFLAEAASEFFARRRTTRKQRTYRYELAILVREDEAEAPSDGPAIKLFGDAARRAGIRPSTIGPDDYGRINTFDALFIRTTTAVDNIAFRFAQRAAAEHMIVIDDPESIIRCANKVFLAELLSRHGIATPATMIVHRDNTGEVIPRLGLPVVLKRPDSGFSQGVHLATDEDELRTHLDALFAVSDLVIAQAFSPTEFDWRIGVLDREPLFACRYHMAPDHWQVIRHDHSGQVTGLGDHYTYPIAAVPPRVLKLALKAANIIGDGLYGVDCKEVDGAPQIIEVNDNPNIDHGVEDEVLGMALYDRVIHSFLRRLDQSRRAVR